MLVTVFLLIVDYGKRDWYQVSVARAVKVKKLRCVKCIKCVVFMD